MFNINKSNTLPLYGHSVT